MLNTLKNKKYQLIVGGLGLATLGGVLLYKLYKKPNKKEELFQKAFKKLTMHLTELFLWMDEHMIENIINSLPPFVDKRMTPDGLMYFSEESMRMVLASLDEIDPNFTSDMIEKEKIVCDKLGIRYEEFRRCVEIVTNSPQKGELENLIVLKNLIFCTIISGNSMDFLIKIDVKIPDFFTPEVYVAFEEERMKFSSENELDVVKKYYEKNQEKIKKGENIKLPSNIGVILAINSKKDSTKLMKILTNEKYFGKDWDEKYDFHPLLIKYAFAIGMMKDPHDFEILVKIKKGMELRRKRMKEFWENENVTLESIDSLRKDFEKVISDCFSEENLKVNHFGH